MEHLAQTGSLEFRLLWMPQWCLSGDYIFSFQSKVLPLVGRSEFLLRFDELLISPVLPVW